METTTGKIGTWIPSTKLEIGMELNDGAKVVHIKRSAKTILVSANVQDGERNLTYSFRQQLHQNFLVVLGE